MKIITIDGIGEVKIRKSAKAKRLILKINAEGEPVATIPNFVPYIAAEAFVRKNRDWFINNRPTRVILNLTSGKKIGRNHRLELKADDVNVIKSRVSGNSIVVSYPRKFEASDQRIQAEAKKASLRALRRQAEAHLPGVLHRLASQYGFTYKEVRIKSTQTRWGSCSSNRIINLTIWLMQLPDELIEYVLCHELTHLHHMHHQKSFWSELQQMVPDYKTRRKELKQYQPTLL